MNGGMMMRIRLELDAASIRHLAVQCPDCENWFHGRDITHDELSYEYDIFFAQFECPVCGKIFGSEKIGDASSNIGAIRRYIRIALFRKQDGKRSETK